MTTTTFSSAPQALPASTQPGQPGPSGLKGLLHALRPALQWRLLLLWLLALLLPTLVAALPVWSMLGAAFDRSAHAHALARSLDLVAIADLVDLHSRYASALSLIHI